ncbi:MAG: methionine adenosyltransferase [Firmicutes bacterium]|nr:methionine adenosyltransferase [Bacillota bacterium]
MITNDKLKLITSESVTEGHPDKVCDRISDAFLDEILAQDPNARVACETCVTTGLVFVFGEVTTSGYADISSVARRAIREIGYTEANLGFDADSCAIMNALHGQSPDIDGAVSSSLETRNQIKADKYEKTGAGDQGMMYGYACRETDEYMPMPIYLAHRLTRGLSKARKTGLLPYLKPDGKSQVTVSYENGIPKRIDTIVVSTQHAEEASLEQIQYDIKKHIVIPNIDANFLDENTKYFINPSGRFVKGGPAGDSGLTGRKIIADTYGGICPHGGGAFSGKDPTKVDRSAAYMARYVAKNIVAAGLADKIEIQVSYAIGVARPVSMYVNTFGTSKLSDEKLITLINKHFDFRPAAIIETLGLNCPIYSKTSAYGHFGNPEFSWEKLDKIKDLQK